MPDDTLVPSQPEDDVNLPHPSPVQLDYQRQFFGTQSLMPHGDTTLVERLDHGAPGQPVPLGELPSGCAVLMLLHELVHLDG